MDFFSGFSFKESLSATITLFAVIDIIGSIPIILSLRQKKLEVNPVKATLISTVLLLAFFLGGNLILELFNVDVNSFAVAGSFILFIMALEMILDIEIFKNQGPLHEATLIPIVFPLIAGPASFTTLLSLSSMNATINILIAILLNLVWVYLVLSMTSRIEKLLGKGGIYIARKFFGIILLAVSVGMCVSNVAIFISNMDKQNESVEQKTEKDTDVLNNSDKLYEMKGATVSEDQAVEIDSLDSL